MIKLEIKNINELKELHSQNCLEKEAEIVNLKLYYYLELLNEGFTFEQLIEMINNTTNVTLEELKIIEAAYQLYVQENKYKLKKG